MPFYSLFLDRFVNGDPSNDNANGTQFEHDPLSNQLRHGGDVRGLMDSFDYLQGMGIEALYIIGMPQINLPWSYDGFSPVDLTLLDHHFGNIDDWRAMISEAHRRGMYVVLENTFATMGDLLGFEGFLNVSTPFDPQEHNYVWKDTRRYHDFAPGNTYLEKCDYPRFWGADGNRVLNTSHLLVGCRDSEFDQYGEVAAFGNYPEWQKQISKFAFVQDRLREWRTDVREKIEHFSCMALNMLDFDGFRIDKALQVTVDAQGEWSNYMRECARKLGKENFYIPGEIVAGNTLGAVYIGRGKEPSMQVENITEVLTFTNETDPKLFIREPEKAGLDAAAFHYTIYRALTRFLGLDGIYAAEGDPPVNFVETWNTILQTNDLVNANTGKFDPRHQIGASNFDVFRWPSIKNGTEKQNLGIFIVSLLFPGIPLINWGEEQAFYILENTNANYVFGRSPMSSSNAWQIHGCYKVGSVKYANFPIESAAWGCLDDNVSLDHRDPSHPIRNIQKVMFEMRKNYPVLNDGYYLQQLSNQTYQIFLPGSNHTPTETGMWSIYRAAFFGIQDFDGIGQGNQGMWFVYQNDKRDTNYQFDCSDPQKALISPFDEGTIVKNLFPPFDEYMLEKGPVKLSIGGSKEFNGCLRELSIPAWGYKVLVPKNNWVRPSPSITKFVPGHDYRIMSANPSGSHVQIEIHFSDEMDCDDVTRNIHIRSRTGDGSTAQIDSGSVQCRIASPDPDQPKWVGAPQTAWVYSADLIDLSHGLHDISINNVTTRDGNASTNAVDHFYLRVGDHNNPMVFPREANYSVSLLNNNNGKLTVTHAAAGADKWRYTLNWGTSYSDWMEYKGGTDTLGPRVWNGTKAQEWEGDHVIVQYWSKISGSSDHVQHSDARWANKPPRRFPHLFVVGPWNQHGFDAGLKNEMKLNQKSGRWNFNYMTEWPAQTSLSVWGINPDGQPDQTEIFGDIDGDNILDRLPLKTLLGNYINITNPPESPHLAYLISLNDATLRYELLPVGNRWAQLALWILLALIPILTATAAVWAYLKSFYAVKFNQIGVSNKANIIPLRVRRQFRRIQETVSRDRPPVPKKLDGLGLRNVSYNNSMLDVGAVAGRRTQGNILDADAGAPDRRTVLIATMEYDIEDWEIKIKIGGLGVMAQLMGKNLGHQDLIWVVPCVGGIDYPVDYPADPMEVTVLGNSYSIDVQYHVLRNITYVLLDAPIFRQQSKSEPYPPRMDDLDSAIYYSAWNSCIAQAIQRFPVDLYHINDYHGAIAPLHLLPGTIPCCLSLHNAEFQGLWPLRTKTEREEVCRIYNLDPEIVEKYVQFGEVFNLLHAAASYLREHQKGFGAVGVSKKYGKRSYARYPIFWGLKEIQALPNPDPSDTAEWTRGEKQAEAVVDPVFEAGRAPLKRQAQEWAGLTQNPQAELFVFVGRWSMQKGVDLIADVFPSVLEENPNVQLICIGPVIDLYGSFAALKLGKMMDRYPGRVFSKPEFTALPPYIFSGAEFALIPSRDEPFGLVAVEFGRKGALGVGARVGGLGQMPGWWYTVESTTTKNLLHQFKSAIHEALASNTEVRAMMRAHSAKQRFPVQQWVEDLETLQSTAIEKHWRYASARGERNSLISIPNRPSGANTPIFGARSRANSRAPSIAPSTATSRAPSPERQEPQPGGLNRMSSVLGPGHRSRGRPCQTPLTVVTQADEMSTSGEDNDMSEAGEDGSFTPRRSRSRSRGRAQAGSRSRRMFIGHDNNDQTLARLTAHLQTQDFSLEHSPIPPSPRGYQPSPLLSDQGTPSLGYEEHLLNPPLSIDHSKNRSSLSLTGVVAERHDYNLQKVEPFFTDPNKEYYKAFEKKLDDLNGKSSESQLCIEDYLEKSEKQWFNRYRNAKLGKSPAATPAGSIFRSKSPEPLYGQDGGYSNSNDNQGLVNQFLIDKDYVPPKGLKGFLLRRIGDWPLYSILLAFGQIISANSYQVTLLTGEIGQTAEKLYIVATIYLFASIMWWFMFRSLKSIYVLSTPFVFYGVAFLLIGLAPYVHDESGRGWTQNVATGSYAVAASSGSVFFALNFGDEGGAPITSWVYRACVIQGTQQIYMVALWYWGSRLAKISGSGGSGTSLIETNPVLMTAIGVGIAILIWTVGFVLWAGLPDYYRQAPGSVPSFYRTLMRRKIIVWFFFMVLIQNYWLSAPYGRNWLYLWSSQHVPAWQMAIVVAVFFLGVWAAFLYLFSILSSRHSWILPIFAIGLGAPRWCQMLWSTSNIGQYVPWAGGHAASAFAGRTLWLWLGVLDALQGVGFGMILLNTLTRFHIAFTVIAAQVIGSVATILARATAPNKIGPGDVFPDFSAGFGDGLSNPWFWIALVFQLSINVMCFFFYRKEQLAKP